MRTAKCLACNIRKIKTFVYTDILLNYCTLQLEANMFSMTIYFSVRVMDLGISAEIVSNQMVEEFI